MGAPLPLTFVTASLRAALCDLRRAGSVHTSEARVALEQIYALIEEIERHEVALRNVAAAND
jgi:hypothetical protein